MYHQLKITSDITKKKTTTLSGLKHITNNIYKPKRKIKKKTNISSLNLLKQ
jgi:hypothetical protein